MGWLWLPGAALSALAAFSGGSAAAVVAIPCDVAALRAAITAANAAAGPDTLELSPACVYTVADPVDWWYGLPAIASDITIDRNGATISRDAAAPRFRFFFVGADPLATPTLDFTSPGPGRLTLRDLTLRGGLAQGGASGFGGGGAGMGGAIFSQGVVNLERVTLTANTARGGLGDVSGGFGGASGGAGTAGSGGGGGGFRPDDDRASGTKPVGGAGGGPSNGMGGSGGAGLSATGGAAGNGSGGGVGFDTPVVMASGGAFGAGGAALGGGGGVGGGGGNFGAGGGFGGGVGRTHSARGGFGGGGSGNGGLAGFGGGQGLSAGGSGGAGMGGAVFIMLASLTITNSTLSGNAAVGGTGVGAGQGLGGAIFNLNGAVTLDHATVAANTGGALYDLGYDSATARTASAAATSSPTGPPPWPAAPRTSRRRASTSAASQALGSGSLLGTPVTADPQLGPLQNNGGPTQTMLPAIVGPAFDAAGTPCPTTDQRGVARPAGAACDLGAVELAVPAATTGAASAIGITQATVAGTASNQGRPRGARALRVRADHRVRQPEHAGQRARVCGGREPDRHPDRARAGHDLPLPPGGDRRRGHRHWRGRHVHHERADCGDTDTDTDTGADTDPDRDAASGRARHAEALAARVSEARHAQAVPLQRQRRAHPARGRTRRRRVRRSRRHPLQGGAGHGQLAFYAPAAHLPLRDRRQLLSSRRARSRRLRVLAAFQGNARLLSVSAPERRVRTR